MNKLEISFLGPAGPSHLEPHAWGFTKETDKESAITRTRNRSNVNYEDLELIASLRQGDETAFATLVERYHGPLLRFAQSFVSSQAVAEEVVQETWMAVLKGIHRFEGRSSLKTWIFQILQNIAKTKATREHRYVSFFPAAHSNGMEEDSQGQPGTAQHL